MAGFKFTTFSGLVPRLPASLLPEHNATIAQNCDLAYGELRNLKGDFQIQTLSNTPASIYTDNGLLFYSWPSDVDAVRSPLANDTFDRLYYTTGGDFRVTSRAGMSINGGQPGSSYRVGVPKPTVAPTFLVAGAPSLSNASILAKFHYEYSGTKYQEQDIVLNSLVANSKWTFTAPTLNTGTAAAGAQWFTATYYSPTDIAPENNGGSAWLPLPAGTKITPTGGNSITTSGGQTYSASAIMDENGAVHHVESLFTLTKFGLLRDPTSSGNTANGTPSQALPVIRLTAKDNTTGDVLFDIYSDNSAFAKAEDWSLGITKNTSTYTLSLNYAVGEDDKETRAYVYTYVNIYNEEGPPSPAASVTVQSTVDITVSVRRDTLAADYAPIKEIRLYRTPTGSEIADYFYVGSIQVLSASGTIFTFVDNVKASGLNEPIASLNYYPPSPVLTGLMALPNGILCAWKGNELHFSDAYKPWSWPPQYVKTFPHNIVGGIVHGSGAVITTLGQPYLLSGVSPDSMTETKLKLPQAGVSKWSLADVGGIIVYASNDGIVAIEGGQASMGYSEQFFTRDAWRSLYRNGFSSMRFAVWDGRLVAYSSVNAFTPFMIRLDEAKGAMTELPALVAACSFVSPLSDQCYVVSGNRLMQFAGGSDLSATWQTRELITREPVNFGVAQFVGTGTWTLQFYATNDAGAYVLRHTKSVTGPAIFRLPSGFMSDRWMIKATGTGRLRELYIAETPDELGRV